MLPLGRHTSSDEIAQSALFLASDFSATTTAVTFKIDGGTSGWGVPAWGSSYEAASVTAVDSTSVTLRGMVCSAIHIRVLRPPRRSVSPTANVGLYDYNPWYFVSAV